MPGYGISATEDGLLEWAWAAERLIASHDFWLATVRPDGRPHVMPVWAVWRDDALWFTTAARSIKARNLAEEPRCSLTTDNALEPVVNVTLRVVPEVVFALTESDPTGSPTRWHFD